MEAVRSRAREMTGGEKKEKEKGREKEEEEKREKRRSSKPMKITGEIIGDDSIMVVEHSRRILRDTITSR